MQGTVKSVASSRQLLRSAPTPSLDAQVWAAFNVNHSCIEDDDKYDNNDDNDDDNDDDDDKYDNNDDNNDDSNAFCPAPFAILRSWLQCTAQCSSYEESYSPFANLIE